MRVLLVRLDGVGDAAVCVPLIAALRAAGHEVGIALTKRNAGLLAPHAVIAKHVLERIPWPAHGSTPESTARASAEIAAQCYDAALIATEEPEGFALAATVPERVGFTTGWARPLKTLWVRARTTRTVSRSQRVGGEDAHEVEIVYRLGSGLVGDERPPTDTAVLRPLLLQRPETVQPSDEAQLVAPERFDAPEPPVRLDAKRILVQAGPKWSAVGVAAETQLQLFSRLLSHARIVAPPGDVAAVRELTGVTPETFRTIREWVGALADADVVVTVDTGAAHVAGMLGTRVVDIFPDAHFDAQVRRWRPWASPYRAVRASEVDGGPSSRFIETVFDGL